MDWSFEKHGMTTGIAIINMKHFPSLSTKFVKIINKIIVRIKHFVHFFQDRVSPVYLLLPRIEFWCIPIEILGCLLFLLLKFPSNAIGTYGHILPFLHKAILSKAVYDFSKVEKKIVANRQNSCKGFQCNRVDPITNPLILGVTL